MDRTTGLFKPEERVSQDERLVRHNQHLGQIVDHAAAKAPAFKAKLDFVGAEAGDIRTMDDLEKLPITEKGELVELQQKNPPFGGFVTVPQPELSRIFCSPGPIYEPWPKVYDDDRWAEAFFGAGMRRGDIGVVTFGFQLTPFGFMLDESMKQMGITSVLTGPGNTELQVGIMKDLQTQAVCATPSFLNTIGQRCRDMGLDPAIDLNLQTAFVAAEMLPESLRSQLEQTFDMVVRQSYGTADVGCLGFECFHLGGMHYPEDCIVELVDPDTGKRVGPGQLGEVVATNFDTLYPLIRFGTGDLSSYTDKTCACGRTSYKLTGIKGRVDQITKVKGMFVHPNQVDQVAANFPILSAWQVVISRVDQQDVMTFRAELRDSNVDTSALADQIKDVMKDILRLKGEVAFVDSETIHADAKKVDDQRVWD